MQSLTYSEFIPKQNVVESDYEEEIETKPRAKKTKNDTSFKEYFENNCPTCQRKIVFVFDSFDFIILVFFGLLYLVCKK